MNTTTHTLVQKLWNYCNVLRDDGMSYGDELVARDKSSLDDSNKLPGPGVIAQEILEDLQAAHKQFRLIAADLQT